MASRDDGDDLLALQRMLLPQDLPAVSCTEAAVEYRPHNDLFRIGGDWYDLIDRAENNTVIAMVGDVVGHGLTQIGVMGQLRAAGNALARVCDEPHELIDRLDQFASGVPGAMMATTAALILDGSTSARYASAGHPPLIHVRSSSEIVLVESGRRPPLGIGAAAGVSTAFEYVVDDLLILYTDGLVEHRGTAIDDVMLEVGEVARALFTEPCAAIAGEIVETVAGRADDDVVVMVLRPRYHRAANHQLDRRIAASVN